MNPSIGAISKWKYVLLLKPWCFWFWLVQIYLCNISFTSI